VGQDSVVTDDRAGGAEGTLRAHLAAYGRKSAPTRARYATLRTSFRAGFLPAAGGWLD